MNPADKQALFLKVVQANIEMLKNEITVQAEIQAITVKSKTLTEDEIRRAAVDFFYSELSKKLYQHLKF